MFSILIPIITKVAPLLAWEALSHWFGKTDKVEAGSLSEFLLTGEAKRLTLQLFQGEKELGIKMEMGIDNLKKVVDLGIEVEKVITKAIENGGNLVADGMLAIGEIPTLAKDVQAVIAGWHSVPAEIKDLKEDEAQALVAYVVEKLAVDNTKAVAIINASLKMVFGGIDLIAAIKA